MKTTKYKSISLIIILFFFSKINVAHSQSADKLYEKIDLFSEVLEKIDNE